MTSFTSRMLLNRIYDLKSIILCLQIDTPRVNPGGIYFNGCSWPYYCRLFNAKLYLESSYGIYAAIYLGHLVFLSIAHLSLGKAFSFSKRKSINISVVKDILLSSVFIFPTMVMFFIYGVLSSILLSYPYIFIREYNMQVADFGWVIGLTILCLLISSMWSKTEHHGFTRA